MNHAIEVLKREERELEWQNDNFGIHAWNGEAPRQLRQVRQAIADLEEKDMQREMAEEAGCDD